MRAVIALVMVSMVVYASESTQIDSLQNKAIAKLIIDLKELREKIASLEEKLGDYKKFFSKLYVVSTYEANVRDRPSLDSRIVKVLSYGDLVYVEHRDNEWSKVRDGYIKNFILKPALPIFLKVQEENK